MMHCNPKTMIKVAAGLATALGLAYFALPEFRGLVLASAPVLLILLCPLSMIAMMFMMKGQAAETKADACAAPEKQPAGRETLPALKSDVAGSSRSAAERLSS